MSLNLDRSTWRRVKFGDVVRNVNESVKDPDSAGIDRVIGLEHLDPGELKIDRWGELTEETTFTRRVRPGQTLFGKRRAYQRKSARAEFDAVCSGDILVFESADPGVLLPELLPFITMTDGFYAKALETSAGSLSPRTRWSDLATYEFDLPPLADQRRIADLLWSAEGHRRTLAILGLASERAQSTFVSTWLGSCRLTEERIGDLAVVRSGATPSRSKQADYFDHGELPWVKTLDLNEGVIWTTEESITDKALSETSCKELESGTVLVAMYGGFGQIGRTAILGVPAATNQAVSALTELDTRLRPEFVQLVLQSRRPYWRGVAASSRKDPNITKTDIEEFRVPVPPLEDQDRLLDRVDEFTAASVARSQEVIALDQLRRSTLSELWG